MLKADDSVTRLMYTLGENLIKDDRGDLGYASYRGRTNHIYGGERRPNHPSPFHHWQIGTLLCLASQLLRLSTVAAEANEVQAEIEGLDLIDESI